MDGKRLLELRAIAAAADEGPWRADEVRDYQGMPHLVGALIVNDKVAIAEIRGAVKIDGKVCTANQKNADYLTAFSPDQVTRLLDEIIYWRQDAAARLRTAMTLARAAEDKFEEDRAAEILVSIIYPTRTALANALSGDIYWPLCEGCSKPLQPGDAVYAIGDDDGDGGATGEVHIDCQDPQRAHLPPDAHRYVESEDFGPEAIAAILAKANAFLNEEG